MRITAGALRGRNIHPPAVPGLRPTPSKVREALFNILGGVEEFAVLDLFAGSGIMAMEALSRGAAGAVSIEQHRKAAAAMRQARETLQLGDVWQIVSGRLPAALAGLEEKRFDLVFADPPYDKGIAEQIPTWLDEAGIRCGLLIVEESARAEPAWPAAGWTCRQSRRYGDTNLHFLEPREEGDT